MRPTVITDLESHLVDFADVLPRHEVRVVIHPLVRDEERRAEAEFFEERSNESAMRFDRIVESEDDQLVRDRLSGSAKCKQATKRKHCGREGAPTEKRVTCACPGFSRVRRGEFGERRRKL